MKYVVLQHPSKLTMIVSGLNISHKELAEPYRSQGYYPTSAGFFRFLERERFEVFGESSSLKLQPHADDSRLLSALYSACLRGAPPIAAPAHPTGYPL